MGTVEFLIIAAIVLLIFGAGRLPWIGQQLGRAVGRPRGQGEGPPALAAASSPLQQLLPDEQLALWGLALLMVRLDHHQGLEELEPLRRLADGLGPSRVEELTAAVRTRLEGERPVEALASPVVRRQGQEAIFGLLFELATANLIVEREAELLERLTELWQLEDLGTPYR